MTEDLRALLRAELSAERPPPLGDVVGSAIRDGRRLRRKRRLATLMTSCAVLAALASAALLVGVEGIADGHAPGSGSGDDIAASPQSVPADAAAPTGLPQARTLTIHSGTVRVDGLRKKATSAAMLYLLTQLMPPGRTSHHGTFADDDLRVQLYLDDGRGPAMVRVGLAKSGNAPVGLSAEKYAPGSDETPRRVAVKVTIQHVPDNCLQSTVVDAAWPDGTVVTVDVATCLPVITDGSTDTVTGKALHQGTDEAADNGTGKAPDDGTGKAADNGTDEAPGGGTRAAAGNAADAGTGKVTDAATDQGAEKAAGRSTANAAQLPPAAAAHVVIPTRPALTAEEAVSIAVDPRWSVTMGAGLVAAGAKQFPRVPVLS